jgi:hypothetical protein
MTNSDALFGTGHGVWKRVGNSAFAIKSMTPMLVTTQIAPPGSNLTVAGTVIVDTGGSTASGPYEAVARDTMGNIVFASSGAVVFSLITLNGE